MTVPSEVEATRKIIREGMKEMRDEMKEMKEMIRDEMKEMAGDIIKRIQVLLVDAPAASTSKKAGDPRFMVR